MNFLNEMTTNQALFNADGVGYALTSEQILTLGGCNGFHLLVA